jgi:hypothetical protein
MSTKAIFSSKSGNQNRGFSLIYSVLIVSILLTIGLSMLDISVRRLILASAGRESQQSFYAADSGVECALRADIKAAESPFATSTPGSVVCNNQVITTGSQIVPTNPPTASRVGGGGNSNPISIFYLDFNLVDPPLPYCAIVTVEKRLDNTFPDNPYVKTIIESRGYNTCATDSKRRVERAIRVQY